MPETRHPRETSLGLPGPFIVNRPFLSLILMVCAMLALTASGEPGAGAAVSNQSPVWAGPLVLIQGLGAVSLICVAAGVLPQGARWRWPLIGIALAIALSAGALAPDAATRFGVCVAGLIAGAMLWLVRFTGRAVMLMLPAGLAAVACLATVLLVWAEPLFLGNNSDLIWTVWGCIAVASMIAVHMVEGFADRLAKRDGSRLAAALVANRMIRQLVALVLIAVIFSAAARLTDDAALADVQYLVETVLFLPLAIGGIGISLIVFLGSTLSLLPFTERITRETDRGWFASGLSIARLTGGVRAVVPGAAIAALLLGCLTIISLQPGLLAIGTSAGAQAMSVLIFLGAGLAVFAILMVTTMSFRISVMVFVPLVLSAILFAPVGAGLLPAGFYGPMHLLISAALLRQAIIWRTEVTKRARGKELMVRSMAAGLPTGLMAILTSSLTLVLFSLFAPGQGPGTMAVVLLLAEGVFALAAGQCLGVMLRGIVRASERQTVSAMP